MYLLHRAPWLKDNQHILQLKAYLFFLKASSYSRGISPRFLSCQEREQDTNVRLEKVATATICGCLHGLELPSAKGPWLQFPHHCTCRPFQLRNFRPNSWTQELLLLPFLLITFLAMEYVHRLHEVMMSDQIESTGTYPLPHRKLFCNYLKLSAFCIGCRSQPQHQA